MGIPFREIIYEIGRGIPKNRKFKAFLVKTPQGKIGFEFLPRTERPGKPAAAKGKPAEKPIAEKTTKTKKPAKAKKRRSAR